jgi:protein tyrosine phosphatase (PTP) superfamily phosphohydrolase (DUF442 family)
MQRRRIDRAFYLLDSFFLELADRPQPDVTWITEDLAVGGRILDDEWAWLQQAGVGAVVDCRAEWRDPEEVLVGLGMLFLHLPTRDAGDFDDDAVDLGAAWIDARRREGRRVLVHCQAGKGRSVLLGAAALGLRGLHPDEAVAMIRSRRPIITPTPGQIARLRSHWERVAKWIF